MLVAADIPPSTTDARAIMDAVENRDVGDRSVSRLSITVTDKAGRSRTRVVRVRASENEEARRQLMLFESPADIRNAGFLSIDYTVAGKVDDQWLYLPSLGRSTRITGADRSGAFMGTDLTYADMTSKDSELYDYVLVDGASEVGGEACWLIEATPKTEQEKSETGYLKTHLWISKSKLVPLQSKAWVTSGKRLKYTKFEDLRQIDDIWVAHNLLVRTTRSGEVESTSTLVLSEVEFNREDVVDGDFTQRRLEQGL